MGCSIWLAVVLTAAIFLPPRVSLTTFFTMYEKVIQNNTKNVIECDLDGSNIQWIKFPFKNESVTTINQMPHSVKLTTAEKLLTDTVTITYPYYACYDQTDFKKFQIFFFIIQSQTSIVYFYNNVYFNITCQAVGQYIPSVIKWLNDKNETVENDNIFESNIKTNTKITQMSTFTIKKNHTLFDTIKLLLLKIKTCQQTYNILDEDGKRQPYIIQTSINKAYTYINTYVEHTSDTFVTITCTIQNGFPNKRITWMLLKQNKWIQPHATTSATVEVLSNGLKIVGKFTIKRPEKLTQSVTLIYKCKLDHLESNATVTFEPPLTTTSTTTTLTIPLTTPSTTLTFTTPLLTTTAITVTTDVITTTGGFLTATNNNWSLSSVSAEDDDENQLFIYHSHSKEEEPTAPGSLFNVLLIIFFVSVMLLVGHLSVLAFIVYHAPTYKTGQF
ncbi:protein ORF42 [Lake sturgeon herpesvirus]|nr:protein ORF42 [Lake sturgeon herpesvirus]